MRRMYVITTVILISTVGVISLAEDADIDAVHAATFDDDGHLNRPANIDEWVFLGSSLGMGYAQENFDPDSPGMFQIVRMEPQAYGAFRKTGKFAEGTMFSLHFFGSQNEVSINRAGFVMGDLHFMEIHYKDSERFPNGFNFYTFNNDQNAAEAIPQPNECVTCHTKDGAYDGVFVQFYPTIHQYLPVDVVAKLTNRHHDSEH